MAKKQSTVKQTSSKQSDESKVQKKQHVAEQAEENLQLPSSSSEDEEDDDEEENEQEEQVYGLSSDEDDDSDDQEQSEDEESITQSIQPSASGHRVNKVISKTTTADSSNKSKTPKAGVIYIGRLPQGFQEQELKTYFQQFGPIKQLILSRNKKTGKSKHFAYIEFESVEVAKIAAETMNNYLLFGHLIKCEYVENPHKDVFKNANRKFKVVPIHKIVKDKHDKPKTKQEWDIIVKKFEESKRNKVEELKSKGIDYDLSALLA
ncbi:NOP15 [Candida margitis]|uniref:NOP15 n=1 Tax=Candida margitis TaxID=1775924 RepID=UPI002226C910|nr:NOP15 [Candida margitis]KAI5970159.1 NOP15 [Candida margitis]